MIQLEFQVKLLLTESNQKSKNFKPSINIANSLSGDLEEDKDMPNYPMSIDLMLSVEDGQEVSAGQVIARIPKDHQN